MTSRFPLPRVAALIGGVFILAHLWALPWFLDDIDGINFAMGVRHYDVALHQPHPPGYPIYILLGKIGRAIAGILPAGVAAATAHRDAEAGGLAVWGAVAGGLAAIPLALLFLRLEDNRRRAIAATILTLACPLFWFTANRPLSDTPGLAAALLSQALAAAAFARQRGWSARRRAGGVGAIGADEISASGRLIVLSALVAGLAVGLRSQTFWLTLPVLTIVIVDRVGRAAAGALLGATLTFGIGVVAWFIPMLIGTGGPARYVHALSSQAGEDFEGVDMLVTSSDPIPRLILNLFQTFVAPWVSLPIAVLVTALAILGAIAMLRGSRRGLILIGGMTLPYAFFHLAFQENETVRYALPLVPAAAYLAVRGLDALVARAPRASAMALSIGIGAIVILSLIVGVPALTAYAQSTSPVFALFQDMTEATRRGVEAPAAVAMHRRIFTESRRAREWSGAAFPWTLMPAPRDREWMELVKYWREGGTRPIWFVADPRRTDLALIDPATRQFARRYRWPLRDVPADPLSRTLYRYFPAAFDDPSLIGGARPDEMDWFVVTPPGWFLADGWALTPETSGIAEREKKGPGYGEALGYVRRRPDAVQVMIGGRNLGAAGDPVVRFSLALDGRVVDSWEAKPDPGFFLRGLTLPAGALAGDGAFATMTVKAESAATGQQPVRASVEQFDLQPLDGVMVAFDSGWHEAEFDPLRGLLWRWASDAATLRVWPGGGDVDLRVQVESPGRYFGTAPTVTLRAGTQTLATVTRGDDFTLTTRVPVSVLQAAGGLLTLSTDRVFIAAERQRGSSDRRRLGLRVLDVTVTRAR